MEAPLLSLVIERDTDIIAARQRTRKITELVGFDPQDQTRITTAVSEIVRNALEYGGGGRIDYRLTGDKKQPEWLEVVIRDKGRGIDNLESILAGLHRSTTGMGIGILGARRLMDDFAVETTPGEGTAVKLRKRLTFHSHKQSDLRINDIAKVLAVREEPNLLSEVQRQNQDLMIQLTELQKRQDQLGELNEELQDTNRGVVALYAELDERADHLRRADELKSRFLSNMSHEFRTPLNSILSLSRLLLSRSDGDLTAEQERQAHFIRQAAENLKELVDDLLDIAKVEAGKTVVTPKEFTAADLFSALRGMLRPLLVGDAVALVFEEADDLPALHTDEGKVSQILRNFISNAIKFTERGEVRIWAQCDRIADTVTFHVRDTGVGVPEEYRDKIWEEFGQAPNSLQAKLKGTGLGLPISKKFAELLHGGVSVISAPGQGSIFSVTIPRVFPLAEVTEDTPWQLEPGRLPVLIMEDNAADAFSYERALANTRYQPIMARNIAQGKRALDRMLPAAILLDIVLETEESWRFLIDVKQRELTHDIPVIIASTNQEERKARLLGADGYLNKPVDAGMLIETLDHFTGNHSVTKVLLVDDEEVSRYLVRQLLPRGVFQLKEASTVDDGLASLKTDKPDVVLLDLNMPEVDGFQFLDRLSDMDQKTVPPAVVMSSMVLDDRLRGRIGKAQGFVSKSELTSDNLVAAIRRAVDAFAGSP